jgi:[ribosomal protein S18]-alanine N-acetyltransferase
LLYEMKANPINTIYVAIDENKVVGFIDYMTTFNSATISQIAVTKSYRKQGVATMLLKKMFESFPTSGDEVVEFTTLEVRASNVAAQKLYIKNGFEVITTKKNYYSNGEDAIYMVKRMN